MILILGTGIGLEIEFILNGINYNRSFHFKKEPLHPKEIGYIINDRQYLNFNVNSRLNKTIRDILLEYGLVCSLRANLMLDYLSKTRMKIVYFINNPYAVAYQRCKFNWGDHLNDILRQNIPELEYYRDYLIKTIAKSDNFEKQILLWCIENKIALKNENMLIIDYGQFTSHIRTIFEKIFEYLDINSNSNDFNFDFLFVDTKKYETQKIKTIINQFGLISLL